MAVFNILQHNLILKVCLTQEVVWVQYLLLRDIEACCSVIKPAWIHNAQHNSHRLSCTLQRSRVIRPPVSKQSYSCYTELWSWCWMRFVTVTVFAAQQLARPTGNIFHISQLATPVLLHSMLAPLPSISTQHYFCCSPWCGRSLTMCCNANLACQIASGDLHSSTSNVGIGGIQRAPYSKCLSLY